MKVLHIASFLGNIGDFANHQGFYKKFKKYISAEFHQLEIRKFYKNRAEMKFDDELVELINNYDLLVLGGGGFFDLNWDYSNTGTTINFSKKFIQNIKIPVLVNAMGYHEFGKVKKSNVNKFKKFLEIITKNKNWFVSVRNDGSFNRIHYRYKDLTDKILKVPDSGFFFNPKKYSNINLKDKKTTWIGLNTTNDLFSKNFNNNLDADSFNLLISRFVNQVLRENDSYKIMFFPHTHQDVVVVGAIMNNIEGKYKREKIGVAPFFTEEKSIEQIFDLYRICSCVIGMRFHANVCCIGMNIPTIGLAGHTQISSLYEEMGLLDRYIKINNSKFIDELLCKLYLSLNMSNQIKKDYNQVNILLNKKANSYYKKIKTWINSDLINK